MINYVIDCVYNYAMYGIHFIIASMPALMAVAQETGSLGSERDPAPALRNKLYIYQSNLR